jgi:putative DNA primase/helicase
MSDHENPGAAGTAAGAGGTQSEPDAYNNNSKNAQLTKALTLAKSGLPVFPCKPESLGEKHKQPFTHQGFKDAATDPPQISAWWSRWPDALVGVPTGAVSKLWVLDADVDKKTGECVGEATLERFGVGTHPHRVETPSGGAHYIFRWQPSLPRCSVKSLAGVDVRGEGGYIIAWDIGVLIAARNDPALPLPPEAVIASLRPRTRNGAADTRDRTILEDELAKVRAAKEGTRRDTLNKAAFRSGQLFPNGVLNEAEVEAALIEAGLSTGLPEEEVRRTVRVGLAEGQQHSRVSRKTGSSEGETGGRLNATDALITEHVVTSEFAHQHADDYLFDHDANHWRRWTGTHWAEDGTDQVLNKIRQLAVSCSERASRQERASAGKSGFVSGVERLARADPAFARTLSQFDQDPLLLGTPSGVVDLRTGQLRAAKPKDLITKTTAIAPAARADCPMWVQFLSETTGGDVGTIRFLQQWAGYCLTGITSEHALVFIYGTGGNGKSVFLSVLTEIMGDYAAAASMETFTASRLERHPTELAMLRGARLVTASETERGKPWAEARIKQMTGGDAIRARFMRQDFFEFLPQLKLTIVGNHEPILGNVDEAAKRRFNIVPFTRKPERPDTGLSQKLRSEYPAILRWMLDGCLDWRSDGLVRPEAITKATAEYFDNQDLLGQWLAEKCEVAIGSATKWTAFADLLASWSVYAKAAGEEPASRKSFSGLLRQRGLKPDKGARGQRIVRFVNLRAGTGDVEADQH